MIPMIQTPSEIGADLSEFWYVYALMPVIAAAVGYGTKIVAIEMMFRPYEFKGIRPFFGWQGIIPRNAGRMANVLCETLTSRLISAPEIFGRLDGRRVAAEIEGPLNDSIDQIARAILTEYQPGLWESLPERVRKMVIGRIQKRSPEVIERLLASIERDIDQVFDLNDMVLRRMLRDRELLERMFRDVGKKEFQFIRRSGIYFGFVIGCVQAIAWAVLHDPLVMPIFGLFTGWFTDWLALKMIFNPKEPKKYFGIITWHGLFLKRRMEVSRDYGALIADEVLTPANLIDALLKGPLTDRLIVIVQEEVTELLNQQVGFARPLAVVAVGSRRYQEMKTDIAKQVMEHLPLALSHVEEYAEDALDIRNTLIEKMQQMTVDEFEHVLRPAFEQDEWKLIAVGAILGFMVGELQVFLVEHLTH